MVERITNVLLVRHGRIENPKGIFYVRLPGFALSKEGREEAESLVVKIRKAGFGVGAIYSSPLERARETAGIITKELGVSNIEIVEGLNEARNPGIEGKKRYVLLKYGLNGYSPRLILLGAEKPEEIIKRTRKVLCEALAKHAGEDLVFVFHADPIRLLVWSLQGKKGKITSRKLKDRDYPTYAEALVLKFDGDKFLGFEHLK